MKSKFYSPEQKVRIVLDTGMILLLVFLFTDGSVAGRSARIIHEWIGITLFAAVLLHTFWNRRWYSALPRGPYSARRVLFTVTDLLLAAFFLLMVVSSLFVSQYIFAFLHLHGASIGRKLHLMATAWAFLLTGFHLGLHHGRTRRHIAVLFLAAGGVAAFIHLRFWERLFLLSEFAFIPDIPIWRQALEFILILFLPGFLGTEAVKRIRP